MYHPRDLLGFCGTENERRIIVTLIENGFHIAGAAKATGMHRRSIQRALRRLEKRAGLSRPPVDELNKMDMVPNLHYVKGVSSYTNKEGVLSGQWVKTQVDKELRDKLLQEALIDTFEEYRKTSCKTPLPDKNLKNLLTVYPMGDPHIGMYAWSEETGEDFDCDIAEEQLITAVRVLVERAPASHTAIILNLGDFFHADNMNNATFKNANPLDVDSRWSRVLRIGVRAMIECIYAALEKHKQVVVRNMAGNHDDHTSQFLSVALSLYFENNKRVAIEEQPTKFWYYRFGKVLLGSCHGDTAKPDALPGVMSADRAQDWGETEHRYWLTGHIHTTNKKEYHGCVWESFRTLCAKDAWHTAMGYRAGRDMQAIVYHQDYGEHERHTMSIQMLHARMRHAKKTR